MFLAKAGEYKPCGIFTYQHLILIIITIFFIILSLKKTINKSKEEITKLIRKITIVIWILEFARIGVNFYISVNYYEVNEYLPLYFCSLLLYAGAMSSFGKGKIKRAGDVTLATGGIVGGLVFILFPTTTLPTYPMLHFLSLHSFFFHGVMLYLGLLINLTNYVKLEVKDVFYYGAVIGGICVVALIVNKIFDGNLMFISKDFPGTPITILYHLTGNLFTPIMIIGQMTIPYLIIYKLITIANKYSLGIKVRKFFKKIDDYKILAKENLKIKKSV